MVKKKKKKAGRPKIKINYEQVERLASIQCTYDEIAAVLDVSVRTVNTWAVHDEKFCSVYKKGKESGKASLRRMQFKAASDGNTGMMIWLGKQYLGQSEQTTHGVTEELGSVLGDIQKRYKSRGKK